MEAIGGAILPRSGDCIYPLEQADLNCSSPTAPPGMAACAAAANKMALASLHARAAGCVQTVFIIMLLRAQIHSQSPERQRQ